IADQPIHALAWSPDGQTIATGYFGNRFSKIKHIGDHAPDVQVMQSGGIRLWSVRQNNQRLIISPSKTLPNDGSTYALKFSPDNLNLAALSEDSLILYIDEPAANDSLNIYSVASGKLLHTYNKARAFLQQDEAITKGANGLAWTHDGHYLAAVEGFESNR